MSLAFKKKYSTIPFISKPYTPDQKGRLRPIHIERCPDCTEAKATCRIRFEKWRSRVYGPGFRLGAYRCETHHRSFTVYPPGWMPYGRKPLALVDHQGMAVECQADKAWEDTLFAAIIDAGIGCLWPEELQLGPIADADAGPHTRKTQRRHVAGAMRLFYLNANATPRDREYLATRLSIDLALPMTEGKRIRDGPSLLSRGRGGTAILKALPSTQSTLARLMALGTRHGFWGPHVQ